MSLIEFVNIFLRLKENERKTKFKRNLQKIVICCLRKPHWKASTDLKACRWGLKVKDCSPGLREISGSSGRSASNILCRRRFSFRRHQVCAWRYPTSRLCFLLSLQSSGKLSVKNSNPISSVTKFVDTTEENSWKLQT